ncbi:NADH dehydrogenase subunit 1 (mitochondrion) [Paulinella micropora]|uniref:NADH-ubiquinone oxidoreductase chain 1 n=1 Tax=Paulinella micropora TaxID=1928728 RepID=A0A5K7W4X3_9EUKA|nr:NADH dehydrogenase subunit 1 [Paulinella micropora]BBL86686.1 NADH dehydrogenase subunit 1 [Paulinella micropora]
MNFLNLNFFNFILVFLESFTFYFFFLFIFLEFVDPLKFFVYLLLLGFVSFKNLHKDFFNESYTNVIYFILVCLTFKKFIYFLLFKFFKNILLEGIFTIVFLLIPVAAYSLLDRKIIALVQRRKGPNVIGLWGLLQFLIDGIKLFFKEIIVPTRSNSRWFILSPVLASSLSFAAWFVLPVHPVLCFYNTSLDLLLLLTISSLNVYTIILAGWSSNSRYAFLGSLRAIAQIISYELPMFFSIMPIVVFVGSLDLKSIVFSQASIFFIFPFFPSALVFFICTVAETNRAPFDLPEAESELVAGYNTEYSSLVFAFFFISEYASMLLMSGLWIDLFFGGWLPFFNFLDFIPANINFGLKLCIISFFYVFIRANLPRYRYDQLMNFGWKILLPTSLSFFIVSLFFLVLLDLVPDVFNLKIF